jgi:hypothetical protein
MPRRARRALFAIITAFVVGTAVAQDHLRPDANPPPDEYYAKIREVFADVLRSDIVVQVLLVPSFQPEEVAGIRRSKKGFEAFAAKPSAHIWTTFNIQEIESGKQRWSDEHGEPIPPEKNTSLPDMKKHAPSDYQQIRVHTDARLISDALTERIRDVWRAMLLDAREPTKDEDGLDGEDYHFSMPLPDKGNVSASIWSPRDGRTLALVSFVDALAKYARGKSDEATLIKLLEPLERKRPNQAMQTGYA